jgi:hypothetical protein
LLGLAGALLLAPASRASTLYVDVNSANPFPPFDSWAIAATQIQDAVDASIAGDEIVVTNGVYATGGRLVTDYPVPSDTRVAASNGVRTRSVNGPQSTIIDGRNAVRCVYLASGSSLSGFTLTNGTAGGGAGFWSESTTEVISNCVIGGNVAGSFGGGASGGTLVNCTLVGNSSAYEGGGAYFSTLTNCLLTGNLATNYGGGAYGGLLVNCTIAENAAGFSGGGAAAFYSFHDPETCTLLNSIIYYNNAGMYAECIGCTQEDCCTPQGDINGEPLFVDRAAGNFRLQPPSPCINAGNNAYVGTSTDLDGHPRIGHATVDLGAYEYQGPGSIISYAWLGYYGLPADGSADYADPDHDGMNNWQEWICRTDPTNAASALRVISAVPTNGSVSVTWQSVYPINYFVARSTNLSALAAFSVVATNIGGGFGTTSYTDPTPPPASQLFYRIGVGN